MATGGEGEEQYSDSVGSEDLDALKCHPCHEDGTLREAVGICLDCQDYLCQRCFDSHTIPKPCRHHQLLDKRQMLQSKIKLQRKDKCTQKCSDHDDEVIKYYCTEHSQFGCSVCLNLDHRTCKAVQYIPHAAKDLATNKEFTQVESQLRSLVEKSVRLSEKVRKNVESIKMTCSEALDLVEAHRRNINDSLDKIQAEIVGKAEAMKSTAMKQIGIIDDKYKGTQKELQISRAKIETLRNANHNCDLYIEMMKLKDKINAFDEEMNNANLEQSFEVKQLQFTPNYKVIEMLKSQEEFGNLTVVGNKVVVKAERNQDINVNSGTEKDDCSITGLVALPNSRLVLTDYNNRCIKAVDVKQNKVITQVSLSSNPWGLCMTSDNQVAATVPIDKKIKFVTVASTMAINGTLNVNGYCYGIDCEDGKLAVSFCNPDKVQVLTLQGTVLHDISTDQLGHAIFKCPYHVNFRQDSAALYVTNFRNHNVLCVKLDGTVLSSYTDSELQNPWGAVADSSGNMYVCCQGSHNIHQLTADCKKIQVLLRKTDGLNYPESISYSKTEDKIYVGMHSEYIKVYEAIVGPLKL